MWKWLEKMFSPKKIIRVSFNKEWGDGDDKVYRIKKILIQKENHLKFKDENDKVIEYRSAAGLNYIVEDE